MTMKPVEPADFDRTRAAELHDVATSQALPMTATPAPEHVQRVHTERRELLEKVEKLAAFTLTDKFSSLEGIDQSLLLEQHAWMRAYLDVLVKRLNRFGVH